MSLVPDYDDSSNSDTTDSENSETENLEASGTKKSPTPFPKLPAPNFGATKDETVSNNSVFTNPFVEAENAKEAILQKHVKMIDTKDNIKIINGKKICWNYRKGRCRFGHNCKFAHDSDVQKTPEQIEKEKNFAVQNAVVCQSNQIGFNQYSSQIDKRESESEDDPQGDKKKRKRPGLTQGLIPGKKVMKQYLKTQKT